MSTQRMQLAYGEPEAYFCPKDACAEPGCKERDSRRWVASSIKDDELWGHCDRHERYFFLSQQATIDYFSSFKKEGGNLTVTDLKKARAQGRVVIRERHNSKNPRRPILLHRIGDLHPISDDKAALAKKRRALKEQQEQRKRNREAAALSERQTSSKRKRTAAGANAASQDHAPSDEAGPSLATGTVTTTIIHTLDDGNDDNDEDEYKPPRSSSFRPPASIRMTRVSVKSEPSIE